MGGAKRIVFAFSAPGEARQTSGLSQGADAVASPGENFMWIGLMPDVPDDAVARRVEHIMQGDRKLDHTEPGPQVPTGHGDGVDGLQTQFVGEAAQVTDG